MFTTNKINVKVNIFKKLQITIFYSFVSTKIVLSIIIFTKANSHNLLISLILVLNGNYFIF